MDELEQLKIKNAELKQKLETRRFETFTNCLYLVNILAITTQKRRGNGPEAAVPVDAGERVPDEERCRQEHADPESKGDGAVQGEGTGHRQPGWLCAADPDDSRDGQRAAVLHQQAPGPADVRMEMSKKDHLWMKLENDTTAVIVSIITSTVTSMVLTILLCTRWRWLLELL